MLPARSRYREENGAASISDGGLIAQGLASQSVSQTSPLSLGPAWNCVPHSLGAGGRSACVALGGGEAG